MTKDDKPEDATKTTVHPVQPTVQLHQPGAPHPGFDPTSLNNPQVITTQPLPAGVPAGQPYQQAVHAGQPLPGGVAAGQPYGQAVPLVMLNQPVATAWAPGSLPNCPPGLEYLTLLDQILVTHKVELLEAFLGIETKNKYAITNSVGQQFMAAKEDTGFLNRWCCGPARSFDMKILDLTGKEVIHLYRPFRCSGCCCPCFLQILEVSSPPGVIIGSIHQEWSICVPKFTIKDANGDTVLTLTGPCWQCRCCADIKFPVMSKDGETQVGIISKQWSGLVREYFTDSDHFGMSFPMDLDVKMKAVCMGALFLIDFMYFEQ